jgi:hypothetical protein
MTNPIIKNRRIFFVTDGGSTTSMTRAELEKSIADLVMRIETKIKSPNALASAKETLSCWGRALALAKQNGL